MKSRLLFAVSLIAISAPAFAEDDADRDAGRWTPGDIVVTGQRPDGYSAPEAATLRTPVPILETPQSIQVLTRQLLDDQEINSLDEALTNVSGVVPSLSSEALLVNPIIRGFEAEIFIDGLIGYGDTAVSDPGSLWNVERVEVAKGPTSTLYGGGIGAPVGGLINLVSKSPRDAQAINVQLRGGSYDTYAGALDANLPLSDAVAVRLVGEYQNAGDNIDKVDIDRVLLAPSIRLRPADGTEILARLTYSKVKQLEYVGLPAFLKDNPLIKRDRFTSASNAPRSTIENLNIDVGLSQRLADGITANLRVKRFENDFNEFSSSPFIAFFPCAGTTCPQLNGQLPVRLGEWTVDGSVTAEFNTGTIKHVVLAGAHWDRTNYNGATGFDFTSLTPFDYANPASDKNFILPALNQFLNNRYKTLAVYLQDQLTIAERVHIMASVRYSRLKLEEITGGTNNDTYHELDPRIGASIDLTEGVSLFAGYATGSRLSIFFNGGGTAPLPERSKSIEGGLKFALKDIGLSGTVAAYKITRTNVPTPDPTTFFTSIQTGKQRSQGVELDLIYEPSKAFSLLASYAYTDAEVVRDTLIPAGSVLPRVPEHRGRIAARYRFLDGSLKGLELGGGMTASGKAFMTLPNGLTSDSYAVFDAQASYDIGPARIGLRIDNLFDKAYFLPYQYFAQDVVRPGNGRSAYLTLGFSF
jgi:iron complex outermembrane receptor protein